MRWKSVGIKDETWKIIDEISRRRRIKKYQVVDLAVRQFLFEQKYKRGSREYHCGYDIDRNIWYAFKLVNSIAQLKLVVEEMRDNKKISKYINYTMETIEQIENRLNIDLSNVRKAIKKFVDNPNGENKKKLNDETKFIMAKITLGGV